MAKTLKNYVDIACRAIEQAQSQMVRQANKHCRIPDFNVSDKVFIIKKQWSTTRPSNKLDFPMTRLLYKIVAKVKDNAFRLEVLKGWRMTDQFNVERLQKYPDNPLPGQAAENPNREQLNGKEE